MARRYAKWITGGLGWAVGGPIGALIGYVVGNIIDNVSVNVDSFNDPNRAETVRNDFIASLTVLAAAVLKADGKVLRVELDYVKRFFTGSFGEEASQEAILMLRDVLKQDIPIDDVVSQIRHNVGIDGRIQLIHFLYGVANADGNIDPAERDLIRRIAFGFSLSSADLESVESMFIQNSDWAFKVLEIESTATDAEVKKAYRKMAIKFHPDKVANLGPDVQKGATEKFQKISEAYELIKSSRGLV